MALGYVLGCCVGANFVASAAVDPVLSALENGGELAAGNLVSALCVSGAYGFAFLLLSTTYLGFFLVPVVFGIKGFTSACTVAAFLTSGAEHAWGLAWIAVGLPALLFLPALLILGLLCAKQSWLLYRQRRGMPGGDAPENHAQELAAVLLLALLASAAECYAVPWLAGLVLAA